ncbi:MAG: uroporphyrinogen decarboxylase family protein [Armatimonadota bacterium]
MTGRDRMLIAMQNGQPDRVPCAPDMSNMIPCRLTGKPFWDIYLYQDPPLWQAYMDAVVYFGTDGWVYNLDGFYVSDPAAPPSAPTDVLQETVIVERTDERIVTRSYTQRKGQGKEWSEFVTVYPRFDPPTTLLAHKVGLAQPPDRYWPIEGVKPQKQEFELLREALERFQGRGVIGAYVGPPQLGNPDHGSGYSVYDYYDKYDEVKQWSIEATQWAVSYLQRVLSGPVRPDFILTGGSGMLVFNTPDIVRDLTLPCLQEITRICKEAGIPSQIHCCGPERELVQMCAEETDLTSINPLEVPPMGNCTLSDIKQRFGQRLSLMGNLHTTDVMLRGTVEEVRQAAMQAIDDAAEGGGFILSTGDQCGRDTPDDNIKVMVEVCQTYGKYA